MVAERLIDFRLSKLERMRLAELRLITVETRIDADLALGRYQRVIPELERLVALYPEREAMWVQLMQALHARDLAPRRCEPPTGSACTWPRSSARSPAVLCADSRSASPLGSVLCPYAIEAFC